MAFDRRSGVPEPRELTIIAPIELRLADHGFPLRTNEVAHRARLNSLKDPVRPVPARREAEQCCRSNTGRAGWARPDRLNAHAQSTYGRGWRGTGRVA